MLEKEGELLGYVVVNMHSLYRDLFVCDSKYVVYPTYLEARKERDLARESTMKEWPWRENPHIVVATVREILGEMEGEKDEVVSNS